VHSSLESQLIRLLERVLLWVKCTSILGIAQLIHEVRRNLPEITYSGKLAMLNCIE